ncbi:hypothetical protein LG202_16030 [Methylobacillus methanolivorans]
MGLFMVNVRSRSQDQAGGPPVWRNQVNASNIEEAYRIGKSQFELECPDLAKEAVTIEAVSEYVEK